MSSGQPAAASYWELCGFRELKTCNQPSALHTDAGDNAHSGVRADIGRSVEPAVERRKYPAV